MFGDKWNCNAPKRRFADASEFIIRCSSALKPALASERSTCEKKCGFGREGDRANCSLIAMRAALISQGRGLSTTSRGVGFRIDGSTWRGLCHGCAPRVLSGRLRNACLGYYSDSSSSRDEGDRPMRATPQVSDRIDRAVASLREQSERSKPVSPPTATERQEVRRVVETAMLAAVTGLAYTISTLLKLEGYLSYILPLPVVLSAMRSEDVTTPVQCVVVAFLLLFILLGPVRAVTYVLVYGLMSIALGVSFKTGIPWAASVPLGACARLVGQWMYISVTSWVTNENLLELLISNAQTLLDNMSAWMGGSSSTSFNGVLITLVSMLAVNAVFYTYMMTMLYTILLKSMGYTVVQPLPRFLARMMANRAAL